MKLNALLGLVALTLALGPIGPTAARAETVVGLGGETLFVFKADKDLDKTAQERSNDVYDRIRTILNNPRFKASDIQVKALGDYGAKIVANGQLIVPIGNAEAEAHGSTHMALAEEWAKHLREVMPKLRARPDIFSQNHKYTKAMRKRSK